MMINKTRTFGVEKFDVVVMNPPYQELKPGFKKSQALWDKFVIKVIEISLIEGGYFLSIHPSSWRNVDGRFKEIQNLLKAKQIVYLEIHNQADGQKTFGVDIRYDFYCIKNEVNQGNFITKIKCQDGKIERTNLSKMEFIPNGMFNIIQSLFAKENENKVEILGNSAYHTQRPHMSKMQSEEFMFPCAYTILKKGGMKKFYSNTNKNGHFGIPKFIWADGRITSIDSIIDEAGELGLTQYAYAIIDTKSNFKNIKKAFDSKKFRNLMLMCCVNSKFSVNSKVLSLFRKDFWVDFLDYNNDD